MDPLLISAASGMKARMESLDMLANNLANSGTAGFKSDREFYSVYQSQLPLVQKNWTDYSQGMLLPTGNPLNLGLDGAGFFSLNSPAGVVYTRNGSFQISRTNQLETPEGYTLRNVQDNGKPIVVNPSRPIEVDQQGFVRQDGQELGQIEIVGIDGPTDKLSKLGTSYFKMDDPAGTAGKAPNAVVKQGTLEQSNVPVADAAVRLVSVMRQFEMLQRAMSLGNDMNKRAVEDVARV